MKRATNELAMRIRAMARRMKISRSTLVRCVAGVAATAMLIAVSFVAWLFIPPDPELLSQPADLALTITDRDGIVLRDTRAPGGERWRWMRIAEIDPVVAAAFIVAEDRQFANHGGIAWRSVARAARDNLVAGRVVSGASTITMQTAHMLRGHERGVVGKVQQLAWALRLERHLSKDEILEQYLNRVPLGQGTVGVEAAARLYFGASAAQLGPGRAAILAGVARSPSRDNPVSSPERAAARRDAVLRALEARGYLTTADRERAEREPTLTDASLRRSLFHAPHFTTRVLAWRDSIALSGARQLRSNLQRMSEPRVTPTVLQTTLSFPLQRTLERDVQEVVQSLAEQRVQHAAAVVLDNASGDVLAWVGSPDFFSERGQVDMVVSRRQPGSALKPFLYARAFEGDWNASSILDDIPRTWMTSTGPYRPRNYDRQFRGPVRARVALASSLNVPAVQLTDMVGTASLLDMLHRAGFASLTRSADYYGLGLSLGNGEVTLLELANAYRMLARTGEYTPVSLLRDHTEAHRATRVLAPDVAALTLDILADRDARLAGFGDATVFDFPFPIAIKTGTSRHFTDNWAVAVTGAFTIAVWVGNFDGTPMAAVSGVAGAGPLLRRAVLATAQIQAPGVLPSPARFAAERVRVCRVSGLLAHSSCDAVDEWQLANRPNIQPDDWHRDGAIVLPARFASWEAAQMQRSVALASAASATSAPARPATNATNATLTLLSPGNGDVYVLPRGPERAVATVALRVTGVHSGDSLSWTVNQTPVILSRWRLVAGTHTVRVTTSSGASAEATIQVREAGVR